jgi:hypothetical protein
VDLFHVGGARGALQALAQQGQHLAVGPAALAGVLVEDHVVEGLAQDLGLLADVLVAAVARAGDDHRAALARHGFHRLHQGAHGVRVVAVVGDHGGAAVVHHVEAARRVVGVVDEAGQAGADGVPAQAGAPGGRHGGHRVLDLEADRAVAGQRDVGQGHGLAPVAFGGHDAALVHEDAALALGAVGGQHRVVAVRREVDDAARAGGGHHHAVRVGGVEHRIALRATFCTMTRLSTVRSSTVVM